MESRPCGPPPEGGGPPGQLTTPRPRIKNFFCAHSLTIGRGPLFDEGADFFSAPSLEKNP